MKDRFNRDINYMRISVTDLCNYRCQYCMPEDGVDKKCHSEILSYEKIEEIVKVASEFGINKIRLTGGEPLIRKGIVGLCQKLSEIEKIDEICITTNGTLLKSMAKDLKEAGVDRLNISIDTLNSEKYREMTRNGKLEDVIEGIELALELGFKIKLNIVLIGGFNDMEIPELVKLTRDNDVQVRFIELMQIGETANWSKDKFIPNDFVLEAVTELKPINIEGVAKVYKVDDWKGTVGLISPISSCFCDDCNRIRLTSDGKLKPCLHSSEEVDLSNMTEDELRETLRTSIFNKPEKHHLDEDISESIRNMNRIGG
ncbi:MAG: GTP 3',8-cyclase MoaA [Tissierellia bacterium]|nr:GTP 3',8-cyclase MoaA [Tissierellia bacterium]